jgi:hypothetical protein
MRFENVQNGNEENIPVNLAEMLRDLCTKFIRLKTLTNANRLSVCL